MIDTKIAHNLIDVCGSVFKDITFNSLYAAKELFVQFYHQYKQMWP